MTTPYLLTGLGAASGVSLSCPGSASASTMAATYAMTCKGAVSYVLIIQLGVLGIYGVIIGAILASMLTGDGEITIKQGCANLAAGLAVGLAVCASGLGMASFLSNSLYGYDSHNSALKQQDAASKGQQQALLTKTYTTAFREPHPIDKKFIVMLIFLEALGLYGLAVGLLLIG